MARGERIHELLVNWAHWCEWGLIGPPVQTQAASAEGHYVPELGDVYDPPEARLEPNILDGEKIESMILKLPLLQRRILKIRYVALPYQQVYTQAQRLRISPSKFEQELRNAKDALWRMWNNEAQSGLPRGSVN